MQWDGEQVEVGLLEDRGVGRATGERHPNLADRDAHLGADLQELQADGVALGLGEGGAAQSKPAQGVQQDVGHGGEPQSDLAQYTSS